MYLVIIYKTLDEQFLPKLEKITSFEFELISEKWTSAHFIPEKGASFELHCGDEQHSAVINKLGEIECFVSFAAITSKVDLAMSIISQSLSGANSLAVCDDNKGDISVIGQGDERHIAWCR